MELKLAGARTSRAAGLAENEPLGLRDAPYGRSDRRKWMSQMLTQRPRV